MMKSAYLPEERGDWIWAVVGSPWGLLALWLIAVNLVTFFVFGIDKWKAKRKETRETTRRVPERTLFLLAALGGQRGSPAGDAGLPSQDPAQDLPLRHPRHFDPPDCHPPGAVGLVELRAVTRAAGWKTDFQEVRLCSTSVK